MPKSPMDYINGEAFADYMNGPTDPYDPPIGYPMDKGADPFDQFSITDAWAAASEGRGGMGVRAPNGGKGGFDFASPAWAQYLATPMTIEAPEGAPDRPRFSPAAKAAALARLRQNIIYSPVFTSPGAPGNEWLRPIPRGYVPDPMHGNLPIGVRRYPEYEQDMGGLEGDFSLPPDAVSDTLPGRRGRR